MLPNTMFYTLCMYNGHSPYEPCCDCGRPNNAEEMIGCDGDHCKIRWYHFSCVGLTAESIPDGELLCPTCSNILTCSH